MQVLRALVGTGITRPSSIGQWRRLIRRWNDEFLKQADMKNIM